MVPDAILVISGKFASSDLPGLAEVSFVPKFGARHVLQSPSLPLLLVPPHQQIVESTVLDYGGLRKWQTDIFVYNAL